MPNVAEEASIRSSLTNEERIVRFNELILRFNSRNNSLFSVKGVRQRNICKSGGRVGGSGRGKARVHESIVAQMFCLSRQNVNIIRTEIRSNRSDRSRKSNKSNGSKGLIGLAVFLQELSNRCNPQGGPQGRRLERIVVNRASCPLKKGEIP